MLCYTFLPYKAAAIGVCRYLCSIYKQDSRHYKGRCCRQTANVVAGAHERGQIHLFYYLAYESSTVICGNFSFCKCLVDF